MDESGQRENRRHRVDYYKWDAVNQYPIKEQNVFHMNAKISTLCEERDVAIMERDGALSETKAALEERDAAILQRDAAIAVRDNAIRERDNTIAAIQFLESKMQAVLGTGAHGFKRGNHPTQQNSCSVQSDHKLSRVCRTDAVPISAVPYEAVKAHQATKRKANKNGAKNSPRKAKKMGEDLNRHITTDGSKAEWEAQDFGSTNQIQFDVSTMPVPVCSCTGEPHQCYKWGSGGWQSSCCTTSLSQYPLPHTPNKKHARMGGRKMSGSVFSRLLTRLAAAGHDLSIPVDLKSYWAKHGTNRYITIK